MEGRVLYALRTKGMADAESVALATGLAPKQAAGVLSELG